MESTFSSLAITTNTNDDSKDGPSNSVSSMEVEEALDLGRQIDEFSVLVDTKDMPNDQKATKIIHLWKLLLNCFTQKTVTTSFKVYFDKLYLYTSRFILKGHWYSVTNTNNASPAGEEYKTNLSHYLTGLSQALNNNSEHHQYSLYCSQLNLLLNKSPWDPPYIKDIINSKDLVTSQQALTLWENENEVLIKVRIQGLCQIKAMEDKAFSLAQACFFQGQRMHQSAHTDTVKENNNDESNSENNCSQQIYYSEDLFYQVRDIFYVFLCRQFNKTEEKTKLKNLFSIQEAVSVIKRLKKEGTERIAPTWREWKHARKQIILTLKDVILSEEKDVIDSVLVKKVFYYWIKYTFKDEEKKNLQPVKELLSKISTLKTDYFYELANVLLEKSDKLELNPAVKSICVEVYIRAMNQDYNNKLAKIECSETRCDDAESQKIRHQLSLRYLRLAEVFINDSNNRYFELTLTAFSLSPSEELFNRLFPSTSSNNNDNSNHCENNSLINSESVTTTKPDNTTDNNNTLKDDNAEIIQKNNDDSSSSSNINVNNALPSTSLSITSSSPTSAADTNSKPEVNLSSALNDDLQTVIINPRWTRLSWEKDITSLQQLCRQLLDTGGPKVKVKEDLIHLHVDYNTYVPPQLDPETEQDYGFEKGYEPEILLKKLSKERELANRGRGGGRRRGRGRVRLGMPKRQFRFSNPLNRKRNCYPHGPKIDRRFKHNRISYPQPSSSSSTTGPYGFGDYNFTTHNLSFGPPGYENEFQINHKSGNYKNEHNRKQPNKQRRRKKSIYADNQHDIQHDGDEFNDEVSLSTGWNIDDKRFGKIPIHKRPSDIDFKKLSINLGTRLKKCLKPIKISTTETLSSDNECKRTNTNMNNNYNNNNDGQMFNDEDIEIEENVRFSFPPCTTFESFQHQLKKRNCPLFVDNQKNWNTLLNESYADDWDYGFVPTSHLQSPITTSSSLSTTTNTTTNIDDININKTMENEDLSTENIHSTTTTTICTGITNNSDAPSQNTSDSEFKQQEKQYSELEAFDFSFEPELTQLILNNNNNNSSNSSEFGDEEDENIEDIRRNESYSHIFKLHSRNKFKKKDLQPVVILDRIIPSKVVEDVASNTAFDFVLTFIQQCLSVFQCACSNPPLSSTLSSSIKQCTTNKNNQTDTKPITYDSLTNSTYSNNNNANLEGCSSSSSIGNNNSSTIIPKIIQEAYNSCEKTPQKFTCPSCGGYYVNYCSKSEKSSAFFNKPGPKRKINKLQCDMAVTRLSRNLSENSKIKSQALGLEFFQGNLVHAKPLEPNSTELLTMYSREALRLDSSPSTFSTTPPVTNSSKMSPETIPVPTTTSGYTVLKMDQVIVTQAFTKINELQHGTSEISKNSHTPPPPPSNNNNNSTNSTENNNCEPLIGTEPSENNINYNTNNTNNNNISSGCPHSQISSSSSSHPSFSPQPLKLENDDDDNDIVVSHDSMSNEKQTIDSINTPNNNVNDNSQGESDCKEFNDSTQNTSISEPLENTIIKNEDVEDIEKVETTTNANNISLQQQQQIDYYDVDALHTILKVANLVYGKPSNNFFPIKNKKTFSNTLQQTISSSSSQNEYDMPPKDNYCKNENTNALYYNKEGYDMNDYASSDTSRGEERKCLNNTTSLSSTGRKRKLLYSRMLHDEDEDEDIDDSNDSNYIPPAPKRRKILKKRNSKDSQNNNNSHSGVHERKIKNIPTPEKRRNKRKKPSGESEQDSSMIMSSIISITTETNDQVAESIKLSTTNIEDENEKQEVAENDIKEPSTSSSATLLRPRLEIKIDDDALQNQNLYEVDKMYLNDKTGYIEPIKQDVNEKEELIFEEKCELEPYDLKENKFLISGPFYQFKEAHYWGLDDDDNKEIENLNTDLDNVENKELNTNCIDDNNDETTSINTSTISKLERSVKNRQYVVQLERLSPTKIESFARKNPDSPKKEMTTLSTNQLSGGDDDEEDDINNIEINEKESPTIMQKNKTDKNKKNKVNRDKDDDEPAEIVIIDDDADVNALPSIKLQTATTKTSPKKEVKNGDSLGTNSSTSPNRRPKRQIKPNKRYRSPSFTMSMTQNKKRKTAGVSSETESIDSSDKRQHTKVEEIKKTKINSNSRNTTSSNTLLKRSKSNKNLNNNTKISPIPTTTNNNTRRSTAQKRKRGKVMANGTRKHAPTPSSPPVIITIDDSSDENKNELPSPIVFKSSSSRRYSEPTMDEDEENYNGCDDDDDDDGVEKEQKEEFEVANDSEVYENVNEEVNYEFVCSGDENMEFEGDYEEDVENLSNAPLVGGFEGDNAEQNDDDDDGDNGEDGGEIDDNDYKPYESNCEFYDDNLNNNHVQNEEDQLITGDSELDDDDGEEILDNGHDFDSETETKDDCQSLYNYDSDKQEQEQQGDHYPQVFTKPDDHEFIDLVDGEIGEDGEEEEKICGNEDPLALPCSEIEHSNLISVPTPPPKSTILLKSGGNIMPSSSLSSSPIPSSSNSLNLLKGTTTTTTTNENTFLIKSESISFPRFNLQQHNKRHYRSSEEPENLPVLQKPEEVMDSFSSDGECNSSPPTLLPEGKSHR